MNLVKHNLPAVVRFVIAAALCAVNLDRADAAPAPTLSASVSQSSVQVAEPFTLELTVKLPVATRVVFPSTGNQLGDFDIVNTQDLFDIPDAESSELRTWTRRLTLESIVTGELQIPSIEIQISNESGSQTVQSKPIPIRVISVLEDRSDPTQFRDIQSVVDVAVPAAESSSSLWWSIAGVSGCVCVFALGLLYCRRKQWLTPTQWALQELDQLGEAVETESASTELVAMELSRIIRQYLQLQLAMPESGRTMEELIDVIELRENADREIVKSLRALSSIADKAKFADLDLSRAGLESVVADSREIVEHFADQSEQQTPSSQLTETH